MASFSFYFLDILESLKQNKTTTLIQYYTNLLYLVIRKEVLF